MTWFPMHHQKDNKGLSEPSVQCVMHDKVQFKHQSVVHLRVGLVYPLAEPSLLSNKAALKLAYRGARRMAEGQQCGRGQGHG